MAPILERDQYLQKILDLTRPGEGEVFAFYEHRIGAICRDPRLLLIPLDDHLVHRGDGVFETIKFIDGRIYQLEPHVERLHTSSKTIFLTPPADRKTIQSLILEVAKASGQDSGMISVFVGRGPGGFTTDYRECPVSSLYIIARRLHPKPPEAYEKGVTAFKTETPAKQCYLSRIKSVDYLPNVLMKREAILKGYDFPLCFDDDGFLAEGATENVVVVNQEDKLIVPELRNALPGTTLLQALELIKDEVSFVFRPVREEEIYEAKEVILLGTTLDALSIVRYNGKPIHDVRPGPVSRRLRELLTRDLQENGISIK